MIEKHPDETLNQREAVVTELTINDKQVTVDADPNTPLLWVIREQLGLTGTKYGCGVAQCGACTVHIDGQAVRSCIYPLAAVTSGQKITTIEGLSKNADHPVQVAWPSSTRRSADIASPA